MDVLFLYQERGLQMTEKQKRFCIEYSASANATQSAILAGYSKKTARSIGQALLTNIDIQNEIQRLSEEMKEARIANAKEMQEILTKIIRQELEEEVIVVEGCGDGVSEATIKKKKSSLKDITKAIETLGKMQGVFKNDTNINIVVPVFGGEDSLED